MPLAREKAASLERGKRLKKQKMELDSDKNLLKTGLVIVATLVIAKLIFSFFTSSSKKKRLPPTLKAWPPLIGSLLRFLKGPIVMLRDEYPKLGSVFTVNLLHKKMTFLIGPEVSAHFFKAPESDLSQQEVYQFNVPTFGPGVVFDVDYTVRQEQFRFFTEALRVNKLKGYVEMMVTEAQEFFSKWGESGEVDLKTELERLIILTASRCLLGREVRDQLFDDVSALFHDLDNGMLPISVLFPYLPIPAHRRRDRAREKLSEILQRSLGRENAPGNARTTCCSVSSSRRQHTSSITSTWTGAYLMKYKEYFSAALDEQRKLMEKHGDKIDHDILSEMDVLYRCIKEALRLHPPLIMLMRASHCDFSVTARDGKTFDIPKGHIVATSPAFANRLPHIFKDPDSYDPGRFSPGREEDKAAGAFSYISFGGGRHGCLGEPFAYLQIKAIWSHLLRNFELELVSPFPEIDWNAMVVGVKGSVMKKDIGDVEKKV
ncbi:hypothetical protein Bca52824_062503 [Brassica carinata]|uniref:Uncharacterized protein n=1 Tax=Brassica carinata TaxID=52824 RepID=A0A8X7QH69_BRACI|nr:hypothetical protein Bca52824_062503 [Brassica carinata]